jgi:hypothetical protein
MYIHVCAAINIKQALSNFKRLHSVLSLCHYFKGLFGELIALVLLEE